MSQELDTLLPENRLNHVWSTEAYDALTEPGTVWARKKQLIPPPDLSEIQEKLDLGRRFQAPIMAEFAAREGIQYSEADYAMYHPKVAIASHYDYISSDRTKLYEVKNLGIHQRKHYGESGTDHVHPRYEAQCLHEAACHGILDVTLVVCFGGEMIRHYPLSFSPDQIDHHVKTMAEFWAKVATDTQPENLPEEAIRALYPVSRPASIVTNAEIAKACQVLAKVKEQLKTLEDQESQLRNLIVSYLGVNDTLMDLDGSVLATFKSAKGSQKFDANALKEEMPEIYARYQKAVEGIRRFLLK